MARQTGKPAPKRTSSQSTRARASSVRDESKSNSAASLRKAAAPRNNSGNNNKKRPAAKRRESDADDVEPQKAKQEAQMKTRREKEEKEVANDWFGKASEDDEDPSDVDDESSEEEETGSEGDSVNADGLRALGLSDESEDEVDENDDDDDEEEAIFEDDDDEDNEELEEDSSSDLSDASDDVDASSDEEAKQTTTRDASLQSAGKTANTIYDQRQLDGEYASSDEEIERNATGDVPLEWYKKTFDHIGYDRAGEKIVAKGDGDEVSRALLARGSSKESKEFRRSVYDARNDEVTVLTDRELVMVKRMLDGKFPHPEFEAEAEYIPYYSSVPFKTSLSAEHEPKSRFIPSKWERMKVEKIVRGIQEGTIKIRSKEEEEAEAEGKRPLFMLWGEDGEVEDKDEMMRRQRRTGGHVPAPKMTLPGHKESYHPPPEYLLNEEEKEHWQEGRFVPQDLKIMRRVGGYSDFVRERFERCLDLYLCARKQKVKLNIDPESLVPRLPLPRELRPFPTTNALQYMGHTGRVRSSVVDPTGEFLATGGDDGDLRIWDVQSGRCVSVCRLDGKPVKMDDDEEAETEPKEDITPASVFSIVRLAWNPRHKGVVAAACGSKIHICYVGIHFAQQAVDEVDGTETLQNTAEFLSGAAAQEEGNERTEEEIAHEKKLVAWEITRKVKSAKDLLSGTMGSVMSIGLTQGDTVIDLSWHGKGDFLCSVATSSSKTIGRVLVHHVGKRRSQEGLRKLKGDPQCAVFHPDKPVLFVATKTHVVAHHLTKQTILKRLRAGVKWISSIAVHPKGDHIVVGSYDCRVVWFDMDLSSKPFKKMKYHTKAVRRVCFHRRYPLMASASDDGTVNIFHTTVYTDDFTRNPLIVPVKRIEAHDVVGGRGVLDAVFHPTQPWIFTAGADAMTVLFSNIP